MVWVRGQIPRRSAAIRIAFYAPCWRTNRRFFSPACPCPFFPILLALLLDQGLWAEVKVRSEHLRLFGGTTRSECRLLSTTYCQHFGLRASEPVYDLEQGKDRAGISCPASSRPVGNLELFARPSRWKDRGLRSPWTGSVIPCDWSRFPDYDLHWFLHRRV